MKAEALYTWGRILLGIFLVILGVNAFVQFMPAPEFGEQAMNFLVALVATGYVMPIMGATFVLSGVSFLADKAVALANVILAPFTINILLFHLFLGEVNSILFGLIIVILQLAVAQKHMPLYKQLWK